ncbi:MAG: GNAT family N-acetyltransferase [Cellulosilyticaceae bacterium]
MQTNRCMIYPLAPSDYNDIQALYLNEQVRAFLGGVVTVAQYDHYFKEMLASKNTAYYYVIRLLSDNTFIGLVSLDTHHDGISKELSYQFLPSYWGNGYALEVTSEILNHSFNTLGICQIIAETQCANTASCNLLSKLGMRILQKVERFGALQYIFGIDK